MVAASDGLPFLPESPRLAQFAVLATELSYLPQNNLEDPPFVPTNDSPLRMEEALDLLSNGKKLGMR